MPRCSVILPIAYRPSLAHSFLNSLLAPPAPADAIEVVAVVDPDDRVTRRVLEPFGDRVRVVTQSEPGGLFAAWNDGAGVASGEHLIFLDCRALPQPGWLDALLGYAERRPGVGAVGSKLVLPRDMLSHAGVVFDHDGEARFLYAGLPADHDAANRSRPLQAVSLSCGLVRRDAFEQVGGFDAAFRGAYGDVDLCLRLGQHGHEIHYCHESVAYLLGDAADVADAARRARQDRAAYRARWAHLVRPDDLSRYLADGLLGVEYLQAYPFRLRLSPLLGEVESAGDGDVAIDHLLGERTRQVFELAHENARLATQLASAASRPESPGVDGTDEVVDGVKVDGINVLGYLRAENGLGAAARGYIEALRHLGIPVALKDISDMAPHRAEDRTIGATDATCPYTVNLICANADQHFAIVSHVGEEFFRDRYNIGVWFWELPRFPDEWRDRFAHYGELWAASSFVANTLSPLAPVPVVRMPTVMDRPEAGSRERGRELLGASDDEFVFLFIFDFWSYFERKNPLGLIEAFARAFPRPGPARLVIKCVNETVDPAGFAKMQARAQGHNISIITGYWSAEAMRDLMAGSDAYASLHRSEGLGLTMADAMVLGKPVIGTGWSGNADFMNVSNSYPVRFELVELTEDFGPYRKGDTWADPSVEHAAELLREVFEDRAGARARGEAARRDIARHYSTERVAELIRVRLDAIGRRLAGPAPRSGHAASDAPAPAPTAPNVADQDPAPGTRLGALVGNLAGRLVEQERKIEALQAEVAQGATVDALQAAMTTQAEQVAAIDALQAAMTAQAQRLDQVQTAVRHIDGRFAVRMYMSVDAFGAGGDLTRPMGYDDAAPGAARRDRPTFEDLFRGSEPFIAERQRVYLPFLRDRERIVDLGCGRGEMLRLLAEAGQRAVGVDLDAALVERVRAAGFEAVAADAVAYLREAPAGAFDAIFSAQFIEHVDTATLIELLALARSRLSPGGVFIAETVNPECFEALKTFHVDLTHQRPIFPQVLLYLCREAGFESARIFYPLGGGFTQEQYERVGEYAVIAYASAFQDGAAGSP